MPTITISKTKIRRGSNAQRKQVVFDQGELVYTIDTARLFVGTGTTAGGVVNGAKIHPPLASYNTLSTLDAELGDLVYVNNTFYQLTAVDYTNIASWGNMGTKIDPTVFQYDSSNKLSLYSGSVSSIYLNSNTVLSGVKVENGILQVNYNTRHFDLSGGKLSVKAEGINEREISLSSFGPGIKGGSGSKIQMDVATSSNLYFAGVSGNTLTLTLTGDTPFTLKYSDLSSSWFGPGLLYGYSSIVPNVDGTSLTVDLSSKLSINTYGVLSGTSEWPSITVDKYGRTTTHSSSIYDTLTGFALDTSAYNSTNPLSGLFNGIANQNLSSGFLPNVQLTFFDAVSSNGTDSVALTLSSAGFITFEGNTTTRTGKSVGRFAIPIFSY